MRRFSSKFLSTLGLVIGCHTLSLAQTTTATETVWSLQQAVQYGIKNNLQVRQQGLQVEQESLNVNLARANQLPSLNGSASYGYNFGLSNNPITFEVQNEQTRSSNFAIQASVPIFSGLQIQNTIKRNRIDLKASELDQKRAQNDLTLNIITAYMQILLNQELLKTNQERQKLTQSQLERTQRLFKAGSVPESNVLELNAQLASDELNIITAQNQIELAELQLIQLLNLENASPSDFAIEVPTIPNPDESVIAYEIQEIYESAERNMPEILSNQLRVESSLRTIDISKGALFPTLSLAGRLSTTYFYSNLFLNIDPYFTQLTDNFGQFLGFNLNVPIFNGFRTRNNVQLSKIGLRNAELNTSIAKNQLRQNIMQAYTDAIGAQKRFVAAKKQLEAFEQAYKNAEIRLNNGLINNVDFNVARNNLVKAQSDIIQAKYDYTFRLKILDFYQGKPITL
jgi:outer membrane protein